MIGREGQVAPKPFRPKSIGDARALITQVFAKQGTDGWDETSIGSYLRIKGINASTVDELSPDDVRRVVKEMELSRMVLFRD